MTDCYGSYNKKNCKEIERKAEIEKIEHEQEQLLRGYSRGYSSSLSQDQINVIFATVIANRNRIQELADKECKLRLVCRDKRNNSLTSKYCIYNYSLVILWLFLWIIGIFHWISSLMQFVFIFGIMIPIWYHKNKSIKRRLKKIIAEEL